MPRGKIRTVFDTSILVSALKSRSPSRSPAWFCLTCLKEKFLENYVSSEIIEEMKFTLAVIAVEVASKNNRKGVLALADELIRVIHLNSTKIKPKVDFSKDSSVIRIIKDESDVKFLNVLYSAKAKFLLTQNTSHFGNFVISEGKTGKAKIRQHYFNIMTAREFQSYLSLAHPKIAEKCKKKRKKA
ncbi:putative toxin-antitoxin system toxin component, PIN family [Palaeococcus ferrophilus]|uniref:putative toxin-antitoxin system toxin component, PIN family n=1 Tax=Palaeococcus ferrophilus TaxID=83868 RepID=UPI00064FF5C9|nr:putative toxin-antitoxin system toxin component, PIN family [Palaeococcus ferrophilus]